MMFDFRAFRATALAELNWDGAKLSTDSLRTAKNLIAQYPTDARVITLIGEFNTLLARNANAEMRSHLLEEVRATAAAQRTELIEALAEAQAKYVTVFADAVTKAIKKHVILVDHVTSIVNLFAWLVAHPSAENTATLSKLNHDLYEQVGKLPKFSGHKALLAKLKENPGFNRFYCQFLDVLLEKACATALSEPAADDTSRARTPSTLSTAGSESTLTAEPAELTPGL